MRRVIAFPCDGDTLFGTIDEAPGPTGLLIVSGGNEIRIGAHRGMASLAGELADRGIPVFRFDRRGVGDSTGTNRGFEDERDDIAAAVEAFRREWPSLKRIVAFGNCDAATALSLFDDTGIDGYVLANPWVIEATDDLPPPAAIRARYAERLRDPKAWARLLRGGVDLGKLARGLRKAGGKQAASGLADRIAVGLAAKTVPVTLLLANRDNTAVAFADAWNRDAFDAVRGKVAVERLDSASHSFANDAEAGWLRDRLVEALQ